MVQITDLFIYPVKSLKGISLNEAETALRGFKYDREWMITDSDYEFLANCSNNDFHNWCVRWINNDIQQ